MDNRLFFCYGDSGYYQYVGIHGDKAWKAAERVTDRIMKGHTIKKIVVTYK